MYRDIRKRLLILNVVSVVIFTFVSVFTVFVSSHTATDSLIYYVRDTIDSDTVLSIMETISSLLNPGVLIVIGVLGFSFMAAFQKKQLAVIFIVTLFFSVLSSMLLKHVFAVERPLGSPEVWGFGFPSTHATAVSVFLLSFLFTLKRKIHDVILYILLAVVFFGLILLTGASRIYLGYHFTTDVIAGFALGLFWTTLSLIFYYRLRSREPVEIM